MLFHTPQKKVEKIKIQLDEVTIDFVNEFNYLGMFFDTNLTWALHIIILQKKYLEILELFLN